LRHLALRRLRLRDGEEQDEERGYERLEWSVLDWNAPSIAFYESLGARPQDEWTVYRLTDGALRALGAVAPEV